jgi:hypothetical protein
MSTIDEQDLINRLTLRAQITLAVSVAGLVVILIVYHVQHPHGAFGGQRGLGAVPGKAVGANAGHLPAPVTAYHGDILDWIVVAAAAVSLSLSVFLPRLLVTTNRRQIAVGTWASQAKQIEHADGDEGVPDTLLRHPALQSDRGKLAYVCGMQFSLGGFLLYPAFAFAAYVSMSTKSPIALGVAVLLACGLVAWFPTRTRVANWIDRQEETLIQERHAAI